MCSQGEYYIIYIIPIQYVLHNLIHAFGISLQLYNVNTINFKAIQIRIIPTRQTTRATYKMLIIQELAANIIH